MTRALLSLRISRRAIGAAVLAGDQLTVMDGRHLTSSRERATQSALRYVSRILETAAPTSVVCDIPMAPDTVTSHHVAVAVLEFLKIRGLPTVQVSKSEVVMAYGLAPIPTRSQVRDAVQQFWPQLITVGGRVQPYVADAAAAALYADCHTGLKAGLP